MENTSSSSHGVRTKDHQWSIQKVLITDPNTPVYAGSTVKLGFIQKPYLLRDGISYGTSLKLSGVQIVTVQGGAGVDTGDLDQAV